MGNRPSINLVSRQGGLAFIHEWTEKGGVHARLSEDEIAAFMTQNERKESKNTQNIVLDGYLHILLSFIQ